MGHDSNDRSLLEPTEAPRVAVTLDNKLFELARDVAYAPIAGQSLVDLTVKRLVNVVSLGLVEVGEQLPSEPELAERLGVSAATLREALAVLRGAGVLATKRGRGGGTVIVREVSLPPPEEARRRLAAFSIDDVRDRGEYHLAIAGRAAALAAERATPAEAQFLATLVVAMAAADSLAAYRRLDAQLHIGIASAARSSRLTAAETGVQTELGEFLSLVASPAARLRLANGQHEQIVDAVAARDAVAAATAAQRHAQTITSLLVEARSELAYSELERPSGPFTGLQPYGSGLGTVPLDLSYDPITTIGRRSAGASSRGRRASRADRS